jgi:hypothetical protein
MPVIVKMITRMAIIIKLALPVMTVPEFSLHKMAILLNELAFSCIDCI